MGKPASRRDRILSAARTLTFKHGVRAASMEAISAEAGVAKPTLYRYFPHKQAILAAIVNGLAAEAEAAFGAALGSRGGVVERIGAAVAAKHRVLGKSHAGSPHAEALYFEGGELAPRLAAVDAALERAITGELATAGAPRARGLAQLLLACASGIAKRAQSPAEMGPAIRLVTERLVGPELPRH